MNLAFFQNINLQECGALILKILSENVRRTTENLESVEPEDKKPLG
jgi:hypothetical protein